jgi:tetratricopeptide (TPR) repeat protein
VRIGIRIAVLICVLIVPLPAQVAIDDELPSWVLYQQGEKAFREGELGIALSYYRVAVEKEITFPEAEVGMGRVFQEEGNYALALEHYQAAYDARQQLLIPDEQYAILYRIASVYQIQERYLEYERTLSLVVADHEMYSDDASRRFRDSLLTALIEEGINRLTQLYRLENGFARQAHGELGAFYYLTGRGRDATMHLIFASLQALSASIQEQRKIQPGYVFESLGVFLAGARRNPLLSEFHQRAGLFESLYYLGATLYFDGHRRRGVEIWSAVSGIPEAGTWAGRARRQLAEPRREPLLVK